LVIYIYKILEKYLSKEKNMAKREIFVKFKIFQACKYGTENILILILHSIFIPLYDKTPQTLKYGT